MASTLLMSSRNSWTTGVLANAAAALDGGNAAASWP